jgi:hypothetical protein
MFRSLLSSVFVTLMLLSLGCSTEAAKDMTNKATETVGGAASEATSGAAGLLGKASEAMAGVEGGAEMLTQVKEMFATLTTALGGVTDADSANGAMGEINKLTDGLGGLTEKFASLPDAAKSAVAGVFQSSLGELKPMIDKVLAIPGVEAILKPAIDSLMAKLDAFKV